MRLLSSTLFLALLTTWGCGARETNCFDGIDDDGDGKTDCDDRDCDASDYPCVDNDGDGYTEAEGDCWDDGPLVHPETGDYVLDYQGNQIPAETIYPGAEDWCNGVNDNCDADGEVDEDAELLDWYQDGDQDGHGDPDVASQSCRTERDLWSLDGDDCNDMNDTVYPGADELCDDIDNDCDEDIDEDPADPPDWWADDDGDGYGDSSDVVGACDAPMGYVDNDEDCDDTDDGAHPDGAESLGLGDRDCNGTSGDDQLGVHITGGSFTMGSRATDQAYESDEAQVSVTISGAFIVGMYEVTQAEFESFMGYNPSTYPGCDDCPVDTVSWYEAALFANEVSEASGFDTCYTCTGMDSTLECSPSANPYTCEGYRLPTEAEWELMARSGTNDAYTSGGNLIKTEDGKSCATGLVLDDASFTLDELGWYCANSDPDSDGATPQPVGGLEPNDRFIYDVHGNVAEWCHDRYQSSLPGGTDPVVISGMGRVFRGGSYVHQPRDLRLGARASGSETLTFDYNGLRLVRSE